MFFHELRLLLVVFAATLVVMKPRAIAIPSPFQARVFTITTPNGALLQSTLTESGHHVPVIEIKVTTVDESTYTLELHLNKFLLSAGYKEKVCTENGDYYLNFNQTRDHCYYVGKVKGYPESIASVSTCPQIQGFFIVQDKSYTITQIFTSDKLQQMVLVAEDPLRNWTCGVLTSMIGNMHKIRKRALKDKIDRTTRFIELYAVSDFTHSKLFQTDELVTQRIKGIVNVVNGLYNTVNMYIVLVGQEVWNTPKITVDASSDGETLDNWYSYKNNTLNKNSPSHDNACLFLGITFPNYVVGLAQLQSMCHSVYSGNFVTDHYDYGYSIGTTAAILTHEIGHNLGMIHDSDYKTPCSCDDPTKKCIMAASVDPSMPSTKFSSCSKEELENKRAIGLDLCLFNIPDVNGTIADGGSICGNGIVEDGEDCDCGSLPDDLCNRNCCHSQTCKLVGSAACASGECCSVTTCTVSAANTQCRVTGDVCDITELCDGKSPFCPADTYKYNGFPCTVVDSPAYCYEGKCQSHRSQCNKLWGSGVDSSEDSCYNKNILGTKSGSCKMYLDSVYRYVSCDPSNVKCGQLYCKLFSLNPSLRFEETSTNFGTPVCTSAIFNFGTQVLSPGFVPNGAKCAENKMCIDQVCVDVSTVTSTNPCSLGCQGGTCNNGGQCECENGLKYPDCSLPIFTRQTTTISTTHSLVLNASSTTRLHRALCWLLLLGIFARR